MGDQDEQEGAVIPVDTNDLEGSQQTMAEKPGEKKTITPLQRLRFFFNSVRKKMAFKKDKTNSTEQKKQEKEPDNFLTYLESIHSKTEREFLIKIAEEDIKIEQEEPDLVFDPLKFYESFANFRKEAFGEVSLHDLDRVKDKDLDRLTLHNLLSKKRNLLEKYSALDDFLSSAVFQLKKMEIHLNLWSQKKLDNNPNDAATIVKSYLQPYSHLDLKEAKIIASFIQKNPKKDLSDYTNFDTLLAEAEKTMESSTRKRKSPK